MGNKDPNLEALKELLKSDDLHIEVALVEEVAMATDNSVLRAGCKIMPDGQEIVARVAWDGVGNGGGAFHPINVNDLVLVAYAGEGQDYAFVIKRLSSKEDLIPEMVKEGHSVVRAYPDKKLYIGSEIKTLVQKIGSSTDPTENVVLGQVLKTLFSYVLNELATMNQSIADHTHIGNYGAETSTPVNKTKFTTHKANFNTKKASPVDDELMLSDIFFTEKGD